MLQDVLADRALQRLPRKAPVFCGGFKGSPESVPLRKIHLAALLAPWYMRVTQ